ncbi:3-dehydroquinate synthase [Bdellovibrionota bacterium]
MKELVLQKQNTVVLSGCSALKSTKQFINQYLENPQKIFVVTDSNLSKNFLPLLINYLKDSGVEVCSYTFPSGEENKTFETVVDLYDALQNFEADRETVVVALGGGVVGDLAGFVASTYNRGIRWVNIPTTLLAQVDSSVGGKTGYNTENAKNVIGTFWNPRLVVIDTSLLTTVSEKEMRSGLAEVVKCGLIGDPLLLDLVGSEKFDFPTIVERSVRVKSEIVNRDPFESGERKVLNFGHTIGHALERHFGFGEVTHGEAVALGMRFSLWYSKSPYLEKIDVLFKKIGLCKNLSYPPSENILQFLHLDKKHKGSEIDFVFLEEVGKPVVRRVPIKELLSAYSAFRMADLALRENSTTSPSCMP